MGISREHHSKAPTDDPSAFYKLEAPGTVYGTAKAVPQMLTSGPLREQLHGNPNLAGSQNPSASTKRGRTGGSQHEGHGISEASIHPVG
jgi:hypothetical protein